MSAATVRDLATSEVLTLERNDKLSVADDLMEQKRVRHLPVLDEYGDLCGIVSQRDLFRSGLVWALGYGRNAEDYILKSVVIKEIMTEEIFTIGPEASLADAAALMLDKQVGCLPVVEGEQLVGILTESDFLRTFT